MRIWSVLAVVLLWSTAVGGQDVTYYHLRAEHLSCVQAHAQYYRALGDPALIDATRCPPEQSGALGPGLLGALVNEVPDARIVDGLDSFLALSHGELACLEGLSLPRDAETLRFFPTACRVERD